MRLLYIIIMLIIMAVCLVIISSIVDNRILKIREYTVESTKIANKYRIVFLSDLHGNSFGPRNEKLIDTIKQINPDLVLIGGDMITARADKINSDNWNSVLYLLSGIRQYPVYYGIGNHEFRMDLYRDEFEDAFDRLVESISNDATVLYNKTVSIDNNICIKGLAIDRKYYKRFDKHVMTADYIEQCVGENNKNDFNILLAHNPEYFNAYAESADLVLAGHVHGGIARLPFLGGVISPRLTLFPKYDGGKFEFNDSTMIVSRGLGSHTLPLRLFNPCEICVIDLVKQ